MTGGAGAAAGEGGDPGGGAGNGADGPAISTATAGGASSGGSGCVPGEPGCGDGDKCGVVDPATGETACVPAGDHPPWSRCQLDADCVDGSWCDPVMGVCRPYCGPTPACAGGGDCVHPLDAKRDPLPGVELCTANCHPQSGSPCDDAHGITTCIMLGHSLLGKWDCVASAGTAEGMPCASSVECARGLGCFTDLGVGKSCASWCTPVSPDPFEPFSCKQGKGLCSATSPKAVHDGKEYGGCVLL
jgi:hypothetical protein